MEICSRSCKFGKLTVIRRLLDGVRKVLACGLPAQVDIINEAFTPSAEELASAQQIVDLFAANPGAGTIGHRGAMLDRPHLARARALLALAARR